MPVHPNRGAIGRAAAIAVLAMALLAGCAPPAPEHTTSPVAAEPVFATDAEALAAAEEAYAAYLAMSDLIAQEGGRDPERIAPFVTEEQLSRELEVFSSIAVAGMAQRGAVIATATELHYQAANVLDYAVQFCVDYSGVTFLGPDGLSTDQSGISPFQVILVSLRLTESNALRVNGSEPQKVVQSC